MNKPLLISDIKNKSDLEWEITKSNDKKPKINFVNLKYKGNAYQSFQMNNLKNIFGISSYDENTVKNFVGGDIPSEYIESLKILQESFEDFFSKNGKKKQTASTILRYSEKDEEKERPFIIFKLKQDKSSEKYKLGDVYIGTSGNYEKIDGISSENEEEYLKKGVSFTTMLTFYGWFNSTLYGIGNNIKGLRIDTSTLGSPEFLEEESVVKVDSDSDDSDDGGDDADSSADSNDSVVVDLK